MSQQTHSIRGATRRTRISTIRTILAAGALARAYANIHKQNRHQKHSF
jgi:hypothetical protein